MCRKRAKTLGMCTLAGWQIILCSFLISHFCMKLSFFWDRVLHVQSHRLLAVSIAPVFWRTERWAGPRLPSSTWRNPLWQPWILDSGKVPIQLETRCWSNTFIYESGWMCWSEYRYILFSMIIHFYNLELLTDGWRYNDNLNKSVNMQKFCWCNLLPVTHFWPTMTLNCLT